MNYTKTDSKGAYIVIPEDEDDLVVLRKNIHGKYEFVIRGDAIDKLAKLECEWAKLMGKEIVEEYV